VDALLVFHGIFESQCSLLCIIYTGCMDRHVSCIVLTIVRYVDTFTIFLPATADVL